ncbi:hypothetical protein [Mycobacterium sp.]|uniref:hypothetical protein n=1 Tax=Mycobacterium sp. TaxID=1785 RepID=UPI0031E1BABB
MGHDAVGLDAWPTAIVLAKQHAVAQGAPGVTAFHDMTAVLDRAVVSKYWVVDEIRPTTIHANFARADSPEFPFADVRDEGNGRQSVPARLLSAHLD